MKIYDIAKDRGAADVLRLHPRTVREYVRRGELEGRVIGGRWRFRRPSGNSIESPTTWNEWRKQGCEFPTGISVESAST
jgi:excisionase family DNA binding protein